MTPDSDKEMLDSADTKTKGQNALAEEALKRAVLIVGNVNKFAQPRLSQIQKYRDLYAGKVQRKFRQPFNVVLPVFAGMLDTLASDLNDDLSLDIGYHNPADYMSIEKIKRLWEQETSSLSLYRARLHDELRGLHPRVPQPL